MKNKEDEQKRFIKKWFIKLNKITFENKDIKRNSRIARMWLSLVVYVVNTQELKSDAAYHYFVASFLTVMVESIESITLPNQKEVFDLINKIDTLIKFNRDSFLGENGNEAGIEMSKIFAEAMKSI